jgi:hypothetical protein
MMNVQYHCGGLQFIHRRLSILTPMTAPFETY